MLIVEFTAKTLFDADYGNVSLEAATLSGASFTTNEPPVVVLTNPLASGNQFSFSFSTQPNKTYTVEHTMTLSPVNWQTLTNMIGGGGVLTATDSIQVEAPRFYRVKAQ